MLTYPLDERGEDSLYGYLYHCIKRDIEAGAISAHEKLPSKRALAKHLGVSLVTVEGAYAQLAAEGYVRSEPRRGYFANELAPLVSLKEGSRKRADDLSSGGTVTDATADVSEPPLIADLTSGAAPLGMFPYTLWAKTLRDVLAHEPEQTLLREPPSLGVLRLREAIAGHLRAFRGLEVGPEQIVVGSGAQTLYQLVIQLLGRSSRFAVEDPGYPRLTSIYESNDVCLSQVPLDAQGIDMEALRASGAAVAHLMPSHQYPTGLVTPISRRYELLGWATEASGRYLIEDDYDCEFRLAGRPIPTMMSIDTDERVIYANTFSRSLGPAFRIAYAVLPPHLAERFQRDLGFYSCTVSAMEQLALAYFIENGHFERHVNRMRSHYRAVQSELMDALAASSFGHRLAVEGADAGLHFVLCIDAPASEAVLAAAARREGVALTPLSSFRRTSAQLCGELPVRESHLALGPSENSPRRFLVSYAGLDRLAVAPTVEALARAFDGQTAGFWAGRC
ncbi:MocR-like pyridoxine biosynthesis transcription factor PdxR [Gordonibacter sp.]|uniref:MocR-like pyridoxine biosynthesis transcription factor PdxR n=1 Tax=Gordonibacter sp. TaxID=1968902 RepID=UPI002FC865E9